MEEQIIKKPDINDYPSTDERTFIELDGKVNWEKYAKALDEFIVKLVQCKNIISLVKEANTPDKRTFEEAEADKAYLNDCIAKAEPNLSKIQDVDKELAEIRGEENNCDTCKYGTGYYRCMTCEHYDKWEPK